MFSDRVMIPCSVDALEGHGVARPPVAVAEHAGDLCVQIVVVNKRAAVGVAVGVGEGVLEQYVVLEGVEVALQRSFALALA